jgi:hydroxyacylglutathione hydrolase
MADRRMMVRGGPQPARPVAGREGEVAVHRIVTEPLAVNCYVVSSPAGDAVVIDPGGEAERISEYIAENDLHVHAVLCTHGHYDHVGAAADLVERYGVPFGIHSAEAGVLRRLNFCRFVFHRLGPVETPTIAIDLATLACLRFGDLELEIIHTPGHSPGGVCFGIDSVLVTGDTLTAAGTGGTDTPGSNRRALEASVRALVRSHPPETPIYPGHDEPARLRDAARGSSPTFESRR